MSGHHKRGGRREFFRGRKRFHKDTFAPGGTKHDPLNIEIEIADVIERNAASLNPRPEERLVPVPKKRKIDHEDREKEKEKEKERKPKNSPQPSPVKNHRDHGSPKKHEKKIKNKEEKEAADFRKNKKEYFNKKYRYGNFDRYYGVRLNPGESDKRLEVFQKSWFEKKTVLDIGCNVGFLTLSIAKEFVPRRILGIDIDEHLIGVARKNIRHYCDHAIPLTGKYPASFATRFGNISQVEEPRSFSTKFPDNIWFQVENFVLDKDDLLELVQEEFDVIMALSITKWIHLNWGDDGMRRFLKRAFKQLKPGGRFIIEPQPFESYRKRARMSDDLKNNYTEIEFKPDDFEMYLLEEIGFESVERLATPAAKSKGFERCIDVYVKPLKPRNNEVRYARQLEDAVSHSDAFPTPCSED